MTTPNFTSLLTALRAFVLKSRPAYKDYLGTESVEEKTVLLTGTLSATGESVTAVDGFTGFTNGQTYKATIGEETVEVTAQYGTGSFSECIVIGSSNVAPSDTVPGWMVCVYNGNLLGFGTGDWAGKQIEVATSKMVPTAKWDVKKLPKECLPEKMPENWVEELDNGSVLYVPIEADFSGNEGTGTVKGVTFAEAQQAYKDGKMLVATTSIRMSAERDIKITVPMIATSSGVIAFELVSATSFKVITLQWLADGHVEYQIQNNFEFEAIPVTVTQTDGEYTATSTYTYEQVRALVDEGKNVVVNIKDSESHYYASLVIDNGDYLLFSTYNAESQEILILAWSEDAIQFLIDPILTEDHLSNDEPLPAGIAAPGTSRLVSRADHVHPKEVSDADRASWNAKLDKEDLEAFTEEEIEEMWKNPNPTHFLTFSSPEPFTLSVANATKNWDGTLEHSTDKYTWTEWDGTTTLNSENNKLYVRGTGNSKITDSNSGDGKWVLSGTVISCSGNIETLLDWQTVAQGGHPPMASYCYRNMFYDCASLTTAPELPATSLVNSCYNNMFHGCTSLVIAPALPATALADSCYGNMFAKCTSLTTAPELPATTLANLCYANMFSRCTSLATAPELPATTLATYCYQYMFNGCTSLATAPELPATTLATHCYQYMFNGCTSLATAPELPATTLKGYCYNFMFYQCKKIKLSSTQTNGYTQEYRIPSAGTGTVVTGALTSMFAGTGGTFTGTPTINTTYYLHKDNSIVPAT